MDKRFFQSIGLKFNRPRWQVYLFLLGGSAVGLVMVYILIISMFMGGMFGE